MKTKQINCYAYLVFLLHEEDVDNIKEEEPEHTRREYKEGHQRAVAHIRWSKIELATKYLHPGTQNENKLNILIEFE